MVDDFAPMRKTVRDNLKAMGYKDIILAENGVEASKHLDTNAIDLVISDWNMPKMDGLELLRYIRSTPRLRATPVMLVTAEGDRTAVTKAIQEGVNQFLIKPFTQATLQEKINRMSAGAARGGAASRGPPSPLREGDHTPRITFRPEGASVLVVDDVATNIDVISGILKDSYRVKAATGGQKALQIAKTSPQPDLILLDVMMPEMDGFEVCRRLKQDAETAHIPVIFLTAKAEAADVTAGFEAGGVDYVIKPAEPAVLEARVATHIRLKQARDDMRHHVDTMVENARLREDVERITRHDLKNPVAAIITTADGLAQNPEQNHETRESLETIRDSGYEILGMINRSLDLYKMETGTYTVKDERVDVVDVVNRVVKESRGNARSEDKTVVFDTTDRCFARGEETLCLSLVRNLLKNAVEAAPAGTEIRVEVAMKAEVMIRIHNQGVIPPAIRETFFDKYATAGKPGGTGLGTYSARLMAQVQGGEIDFVSDKTSGTTLHVTLPAHPGGRASAS